MESEPLVSIITLSYNHERYIGDCIESVQAQTYTQWEMLVVDDGSSDKTVAVAEHYALEDKRIRLFMRQNIGVFRMNENYNYALAQSSGKYIAILDGDDVWLPQKLEIQIPLLEDHSEAVVCFGQAYRSNHDLTKNMGLSPTSAQWSHIQAQLLVKNVIPALTAVIRGEALHHIGGFQQSHQLPLVDLPTFLKLSLTGDFIFTPRPLGKWRHHGNEVTLTHAISIAEGVYRLSLDFYRTYKERGHFAALSEKMIYRAHHKNFVMHYARSGRKKLLLRDHSGARKDYLRAIFKYGWSQPLWKLRALTGYLFSIFHLDLEKFVRFLGKPSFTQ